MYVPPYTHTPSQARPSGSLELALGTSLFWAAKGKAGPRSHPLPDPTPRKRKGEKSGPQVVAVKIGGQGDLPGPPHQQRSRWTRSHLK